MDAMHFPDHKQSEPTLNLRGCAVLFNKRGASCPRELSRKVNYCFIGLLAFAEHRSGKQQGQDDTPQSSKAYIINKIILI